MLLPNNKEGRGHVGVSFTNCELRGPDQGMTSWRAYRAYAYVQGTDLPLKMRVRIWPSSCVGLSECFGPTRAG